MPDLPLMFKLEGRRCVVVGGGPVALRRRASLAESGGIVTAIAPDADPELAACVATLHRRPYQRGDLAGAFLVVIATDDSAVNQSIADDARAIGVLVNRADDPDTGDLAIPAISRHGPITLAIHTSGISAAAAAKIRDELAAALDPAWVELLQAAAPYRQRIRDNFPDPAARRQRLLDLTSQAAMDCLKQEGNDALHQRMERLTRP